MSDKLSGQVDTQAARWVAQRHGTQADAVTSGLALVLQQQMHGLLLSISLNPANAESSSACHPFLLSRPQSLS